MLKRKEVLDRLTDIQIAISCAESDPSPYCFDQVRKAIEALEDYATVPSEFQNKKFYRYYFEASYSDEITNSEEGVLCCPPETSLEEAQILANALGCGYGGKGKIKTFPHNKDDEGIPNTFETGDAFVEVDPVTETDYGEYEHAFSIWSADQIKRY